MGPQSRSKHFGGNLEKRHGSEASPCNPCGVPMPKMLRIQRTQVARRCLALVTLVDVFEPSQLRSPHGFHVCEQNSVRPLAAQTLPSFATRAFHVSAVGGDGLLLRSRSLLPMPGDAYVAVIFSPSLRSSFCRLVSSLRCTSPVSIQN